MGDALLFARCLSSQNDQTFASPSLPLFSRCRNATCVLTAHEQLGGAHIPRAHQPAGNEIRRVIANAMGELPHAPPVKGVAEVPCSASDPDEAQAVKLAQAALRWNLPLVLRGCANSMPAIARWANDTYLRAVGPDAFAPVLEPGHETGSTTVLDELDPSLLVDTWWPSPLGELLWNFAASPRAKGLWVTPGGKRAAMHYDTFDVRATKSSTTWPFD
jgi:hypothetical protein